MKKIAEDLSALERHVEALNKAADQNVPADKMAEGVNILTRLAKEIVDQSSNTAYFGLSADVHEMTEPAQRPDTVSGTGEVGSKTGAKTKLSYDIYKTNAKLAERILDQMNDVNTRIDEIVALGKKGFRANDARRDIHEVTAKVAGITADVDLTVPWVHDDLQRLAARAKHLHSLFFPKSN